MPNSTYTDEEAIDFASAMAAFESKQFTQAMQLFAPFAPKGDAQAKHLMAIMHQNGLGCVPNPMQAYKFMKESAESGYAMAQHGLGFMYMQGECANKNSAEAIKWFELAAEQGLQGSLTTLGMMYEQGDGVEKDLDKAQALYKKAGFNDLA